MTHRSSIGLAMLATLVAPLAVAAQTGANETAADARPDTKAAANGVSVPARALQHTLYDVIALRYQVQQAHWNVVGEEFYQLHDVTGDFYEALDGLVDQVAEHRLTLGYPATAQVGAVADNARLATLPNGYLSTTALVDSLTASYERLAASLEERIAAVGDAGDLVSQDALIGVASMIEKQRWIIASHARQVEEMPAGREARR